MVRRAFALLVLWGTLALAGACADSHGRTAATGTVRMADTLAVLNRRALADPKSNAFLNRERVAALRSQLRPGPGDIGLRKLIAREQLAAGQTRAAIATLESLLHDAGAIPDRMAWGQKDAYDLLGIAWLRLGEQENCNLNPSAGVCILPLSGEARHMKQEGARHAIAVYQDLLRRFPHDYGSRWLLNVAYMAVGEYPAGVPAAYLIPGLDRRDGRFPPFYNVAGNVGLAVTGGAGGACFADFNGDGLTDLLKTSWGLNDPVHLFLADGTGGFVDRTAESGLAGIVGGLNCVHADYDNDGLEDVLIVRGAWLDDAGAFPMSLLRNRGGGRFEDVTYAAGLGSRNPRNSAAWADFNLDGFVDLFVGNESSAGLGGRSRPSELFLNNGDGTFTEVAHQVGIDLDAFVKGVVWGDVNNDGLPDLYASVMFGDNHLFLNRGGHGAESWRFDDISASAGVREPQMSFPAWFWDYDNDGREDLLVLSYDIGAGAPPDPVAMEYLGLPPMVERKDGRTDVVAQSRLYHNEGNDRFADVTVRVGLAGKVIYAMGSNFGDIDNDGWLDFYVGTGTPDLRAVIPNRMFRSVAGRRFEEVTLDGGFGHLQKGHGTAFVDLDRDGDEDVFMVMGGAYQGDGSTSVLFENPGWAGRNWITLELEGAARANAAGTAANRSAIGARVELVVALPNGATRHLYRTIGTGGSFGSGSLQLHVGLDAGVRVRELRVRWPDAAQSTSTFTDIAVNRAYRVAQGAAIEPLERPSIPFRREPGTVARHHGER